MESHLYEGVEPSDFYNKLENVLSTQTSAVKINIALGYELISKTDPDDIRYFYPNLANTYVFNKPVAINSKADIRKSVISEIWSMELADKLNYPSSGYKLKAITAFKIFIYHREHSLGDSEAVIPKIIRKNKHVINLSKTNNKCVFHFKNHKKNQCELVNIESFPAEQAIYKPAQNAIRSLLTKYSIKNTDQYIDHFIVYDFEAILKPTATQHGENTVFTNEHIPVSVSVADSLTEEVRCFVIDDPKMLLTDMFKYIVDVSVKIQQYNVKKYKSLVQKIISAHGLTGMEIPGVDLGRTYKMSDVVSWIEEGKYASFFDFHRSLGFGKQRSDYGPGTVFGFNSGRYDIYLIKKDLFAVIGTDNIKSVIKTPSYMCIATSDMKMLDITNFVPAGTSYDKYLTTYLGGCKCDDKIRCVCGLGKGLFPYEYITAFNVLNQTTIPPKSTFNSKLRGTSITKDDYERVKFLWEYYEMKSIKDLLIWYNNLDVVPFIKAIKAQRELFKRFDLDMFADGVSLPGLSEKVMYQTCFNNLQYPDKKPANASIYP
ncbi:unnamed protein product [Phytophthora lilii]|uniref:Unnamed protein product n=1 Tax=Phytophthora lilii TaxID=2077276 RepID=A0A9W7CSU2_9STRA|nr:unnamed protein product [Phytophthora lilii]